MIKKLISIMAGTAMLLCGTLSPIMTGSAVSLDFIVDELESTNKSESSPPIDSIPVNDCIQNLDKRVIKVMIDPGHFSYYNQSPVYSPYWESVMTWKLSNYLQEELTALGVHADLTKDSLDEDPTLNDRGFKSKGYDFFISMHSNAGAYESTDQPLAIIYQDLPWTTIDDTSREMGEILAQTVAEVMETRQKGITYQRKGTADWDRNGIMDDEWYSVLFGSRYVGTPGILLEHSFHTNYRATLWLYNDDNLKKLAKEEAQVIFSYFSEKKIQEYGLYDTGDVNQDGIINASDASLILEMYSLMSTSGETALSDDLQSSADINSDGLVDASDASAVLEYYSYISTGGEDDITTWMSSK
ncbi:MAG: N-acetylmuramoyl-L-alanine amidase [Ruminococcus flavefaciens]|nr:N-acetylmuramoyl-L-alanine amidase [Ruminococcus flavefaciens]MCM1230312.1 N-acetylmuramoyl-L-alanine amidase [Ruminococcus flavefaciens]